MANRIDQVFAKERATVLDRYKLPEEPEEPEPVDIEGMYDLPEEEPHEPIDNPFPGL